MSITSSLQWHCIDNGSWQDESRWDTSEIIYKQEICIGIILEIFISLGLWTYIIGIKALDISHNI